MTMVKQTFTQLAQFQPKQIEAWNTLFNNQCKYLLYGGAAHGGKSYFLRWASIGLAMHYFKRYRIEDVTIGLFSEDYPTLKDRQIIKFKNEMPDWLGELREFRDEGFAYKLRDAYGGGMVLLRNLDDPSKYASTEFAAELVEEITKNPEETFDDLRFRLRYPGVEDTKFVAATNPGGIGHAWVKKKWVQQDPNNPDPEQDRFFFVPSTVYDNKFTQQGYIDQLKSLPEQKRKAFLEGSWDIFAGQVFTEWAVNTHVVKNFEIPKEWKRYISMDWGSNKPFSIGWFAVDYDGHTYLYRELYMNSSTFEEKFGEPLTAQRLARVILGINKKSKEDYEYMTADPSMWNKILLGEKSKDDTGESYAEIMTDEGLKMFKGDNDRINGMAKFREMLSKGRDGRPKFQVFESCYDTIRTIPALIYDKHRVEDVDCFVKGTLISTPQGDKKVEQIKIGDLVITPIGNRKIIKSGISGTSETVIEVFLSNGKTLKGTANHKIFVKDKGLIELQKLSVDDILMVRNIPLFNQIWQLNKLYITVSHTAKVAVGSITDRVELISKKVIKSYIGKYIKKILGKYQKVLTYITKITTATTTSRLIYKLCLNWNTPDIITKLIKKLSKTRLTNGKEAKKENRYYEITQERCETTHRPENKSVEIVKLLLKLNTLQRYFAKTAKILRECIKKFVPNAIENFYKREMVVEQHKPVHIVAVGNYEKEKVYRLTVEEAHLYYANGVLVTNTDGEDHTYDMIRYHFMSRPVSPDAPVDPIPTIRKWKMRQLARGNDEEIIEDLYDV